MAQHTQLLLERAFSKRIAGEWESAVVLCRKAFDRSIGERDTVCLIESVLATGFCYSDTSQYELADEQLELALILAQLSDAPGLAARACNGKGVLKMLLGANDEAERLYREARELAVRADNPLTIGSIDQNLGTIATIRGDLTDALSHYTSSLRYYEIADQQRNIGLILNNLGMLQIDLKQLDEAKRSLDRALTISRDVSDVVTESIVHVNRAELFIALSDLVSARASCDEAFEVSSRLGDNRVKSDALRFYGVIYRETGKPHLAEIHLRQAIAIASKYANPLTEAEARRELALVLRAQERNQEALEALNQAHALFTTLQAKQDQADINKRLTQLEEDFLALVRVWGESIEAKDRYTSGHCQRVADYACLIAERAGLSDRDMVWFRMGAFLHDVGKTDIPGEILNKPGRLTDEERAIIERHPVIGDEMLAPIPFPWDIRPMVRGHHERWDGRGYPDGLVGQEIHLTARILRIADIFDALTTTRSYREPLTAEQARQIMREDNGSFDPDLFSIFEELYPQFEVMVAGVHAARMPRADHPANAARA